MAMALFPVTDFQFVFYGFATLAATVGYACAKRRYSTSQEDAPVLQDSIISTSPQESDISSGYSTSDEKASSDTEPTTLKRKSTDDHHTSERPRKRSRSPSFGDDRRKKQVQSAIPKPSESAYPNTTSTIDISGGDVMMTQEAHVPLESAGFDRQPTPVKESIVTRELPAVPITSSPPPMSPTVRPRGFAAFAGAGSAFSASQFVANGPATPSPERPIWCRNGDISKDQSSPVSFHSGRGCSAASEASGSVDGVLPSETALSPNHPIIETTALAAMETRVKDTVAHLTGEEEETVKTELKGVKLFIKRGNKGFTGGMPGHIKLLSHSNRAEERLLFRREPLWKVSMNVRVRPTVRCTFDEEDNVLRIVLKEAVEYGDELPELRPQELVVYALKRGRIPKKEFKDFAQALVANPLFKPTTSPGPSTVES